MPDFKIHIETSTSETIQTLEATHPADNVLDLLDVIKGLITQEVENAAEVVKMDIKVIPKIK